MGKTFKEQLDNVGHIRVQSAQCTHDVLFGNIWRSRLEYRIGASNTISHLHGIRSETFASCL